MGFVDYGRRIPRRTKHPKKKRRVSPKYKFTDLPTEVLLQVFCHTKISENNLPLVNKQFHKLFQFRSFGSYHVKQLIEYQFMYDLNTSMISLFPRVDQLVQKFKSRNLEGLESYKSFRKNVEFFRSHRYGLDISLFRYRFAHSLDFKYFDRFVLLDPENIEAERQNRLSFLLVQIKSLKHEIKQLLRSQNTQTVHVNYDELSLLAEKLFNDRELGSNSEEERNTRESSPETLDTPRDTPAPEDEVAATQDQVYQSEFAVPYVEAVFDDINSLDTFVKVISLIQNLDFQFQNLNGMMVKIIDNGLPFKDKLKVLQYVFKQFIADEKQDTEQPLFEVSVSVILRLFGLLLESKYNSKCEKLVHMFLEHFYRFHHGVMENNTDGSDISEADGELWSFVKKSKEADLFEILCGYSAPNFTL